jgi:Fic family protein
MERDCPRWREDRSREGEPPTEAARRLAALREAITDGREDTFAAAPAATLRRWHRRTFDGLVPLDCYAGSVRGPHPDHPCLARDVRTGGGGGTPWQDVARELDAFDRTVRTLVDEADALARSEAPYAWTLPVLDAVARIAAEIVRIHPFLNGNGRMSRLATAWLLHRYGFAADAVPLDPPPDVPYGLMARAAMAGDHLPMRNYVMSRLGLHPSLLAGGRE